MSVFRRRVSKSVRVITALTFAFGVVATPAGAQTIAELQAQINALMAQLSALQGGSTPAASTTFTSNLTLGSTGAQVVALQQVLVAGGHLVMPTGVAMGYFGPLTQAAVAKWQAANGVSPASGYWGPVSRTFLNTSGRSAITTEISTSSYESRGNTSGRGNPPSRRVDVESDDDEEQLEILDIENATLSGSTLAVRSGHGCALIIGEYVYLFGGENGSPNFSAKAIQRAPISDPTNWTSLGTNLLPQRGAWAPCAVIGDYIYMFGSVYDNQSAIMRAPISDPTNWSLTGSSLPGGGYNSQLLIVNNNLYIFTGDGSSNQNEDIYTASALDPLTWTNQGALYPNAKGGQLSAYFEVGDYLYGISDGVVYRAPTTNPLSWSTYGEILPPSDANNTETWINEFDDDLTTEYLTDYGSDYYRFLTVEESGGVMTFTDPEGTSDYLVTWIDTEEADDWFSKGSLISIRARLNTATPEFVDDMEIWVSIDDDEDYIELDAADFNNEWAIFEFNPTEDFSKVALEIYHENWDPTDSLEIDYIQIDPATSFIFDVNQPNTIIIGDYAYIMGAFHNSFSTSKIFRSPITNMLAWEDTGFTLPQYYWSMNSSIRIEDVLYILGGNNTSYLGTTAIQTINITDSE